MYGSDDRFMSDKVRKGMAAGSWIRRMFDEGNILRQKYGADKVFDLTLGNPVMEPPPEFRRELKKLADNPVPGMHRYMENAGYMETRAAVAAQLARETGIRVTAADVVMTSGAAAAMNVALKTTLNPGEEVIVFAPYFVEYLGYIDNHGGVPKIVPTDEQFVPRLDALEDAIGRKTRAVIVNSPNNPTGVVYNEGLMRKLGNILAKKESEYGTRIFLLSDEPYRKLIYDGLKYPSPLLFHPSTVIAMSHSKDLALPGERIGYLAISPDCPNKQELVDGFIYCNRTLGFVNAPALMQRIVAHLQDVTVSITDYQKKRDFLYKNLTEMGYVCHKPQGAFYMFPKSPITDDVEFVRALQEELVLAVPGQGFGGPGHFRISYCADDRTLAGALDGLRKTAKRFGLRE
ncbi:MAG: pyridoxal phosphate-dependent aminotransferase [Dehalococcoidia bacterium]|nr:pyridoxal phosphate-dependent aminotransferase [Dehalococcoidia bacterium]